MIRKPTVIANNWKRREFDTLMWRLAVSAVFLCVSWGLKCELKELVGNRVQCVFHDRGVNAEEFVMYQKTLARNSNEAWRYSTGLDCNKTIFEGHTEEEFKQFLLMLLPDVQWCGEKGRFTALSYEDLVYYMQTEKCCEEHASCGPVIGPGTTQYNITNVGVIPRYHCNCERSFHKCLKTINKGSAGKIGFTYFTLIAPQCFKEDNPKAECKKFKAGRCIQYKYNRAASKLHQWFDVPVF